MSGRALALSFPHARWALALASGAGAIGGGFLLVAQALKAIGWGRLFVPRERPHPLALAAGNGGAALIGTVLPGRFDDAMRVAVVRRYPGCPVGVPSLPRDARADR